MFKKNYKFILSIIILVVTAAVLVVLYISDTAFSDDLTLNNLLNDVIIRLIISVALFALTFLLDCKKIFIPYKDNLINNLIWCFPCLLVVLANFPFTTLIAGSAKIIRSDLIWLYTINCICIGLMEEILFRGLIQTIVKEKFELKKYGKIFTVLITSAIFGLIHLCNIIAGANIGETFLQVGYSFLLGAMFSAIMIKTNNLWLCILLHAAFDFGGKIISELGSGTFHDVWFWIFTAVAGIICFIHIIIYLLRDEHHFESSPS